MVPAPAKMNAIAPLDVVVSAGPTGMEPSQTGFFQVLNIATKINKVGGYTRRPLTFYKPRLSCLALLPPPYNLPLAAYKLRTS